MSAADFIVFGAPCLGEAEIQEVVACLRSGWIGTGPRVARFEQAFGVYQGFDHVAAVNSCTAALHLSLIAANLEPGAEVIVPALTFCATVNAVIHAGLTPVLADVDPVTLTLDPADVEAKITSRTRAVVPVHFAGRPCEMDRLMGLALRHDLKVIEDCAHAIETRWQGRPAGSFGDFGCFSFYVTKNIVTGEGGMVTARRAADIDRIKVLALHGMSQDAWHRFSDQGYRHYQVTECGFKYNMMDLQAALGLHQLARIETFWQRRRQGWQRYQEMLADLPVIRPAEPAPQTRHAYHLYTIQIESEQVHLTRDELLKRLTAAGVGCGVHYLSIAEHPYYQRRFGWCPEDCPVAMVVGRRILSLPLSPGLRPEQAERVVLAVRRALTASGKPLQRHGSQVPS